MSLYLSKHNLHPFTRWSGCFADQPLFPNRDRSKKSSHGHHLSPCHLNNEEIQLHVFANFFPGKRLAKLLCFIAMNYRVKITLPNENAWNPMGIPKHKNAMGLLGWGMTSCDSFVQKKMSKKSSKTNLGKFWLRSLRCDHRSLASSPKPLQHLVFWNWATLFAPTERAWIS